MAQRLDKIRITQFTQSRHRDTPTEKEEVLQPQWGASVGPSVFYIPKARGWGTSYTVALKSVK